MSLSLSGATLTAEIRDISVLSHTINWWTQNARVEPEGDWEKFQFEWLISRELPRSLVELGKSNLVYLVELFNFHQLHHRHHHHHHRPRPRGPGVAQSQIHIFSVRVQSIPMYSMSVSEWCICNNMGNEPLSTRRRREICRKNQFNSSGKRKELPLWYIVLWTARWSPWKRANCVLSIFGQLHWKERKGGRKVWMPLQGV